MKAIPPLLQLAEGRKVVVRTPIAYETQKEFRLQTDAAKFLTDFIKPDWIWTHFPAGERRDVITGAKLKRFGLKRGWSDLLLLPPTGILHALELKREGEILSDAQKEFQAWFLAHNLPHAIAWSMQDVRKICRSWDCLHVRFV